MRFIRYQNEQQYSPKGR